MLSNKQKKVLEKFSKLNPIKIECSNISMGYDQNILTIGDNDVYEIPGQDTLLIFGEIQKSMNIDQLKELINQQMKEEALKKDEDETEEVNEVVEEKVEVEEDENIKDEDVTLLIEQTKCTKKEAIKALMGSNYDVVKAMIELNK
ncbi:GAL4 DNA binding enhancer prt 2 [Nucleospora cyclopteri]